jgi:hypothetical protein
MAEQNSISLSVEAWAIIVIKRWESKISQLGIGSTGALAKSFLQHVFSQASGDPEKIDFTFNDYGKFVDMGVGKGVTISQRGIGTRTAKPWYSVTFYSEVKRLGEILSQKYAYQAQTSILNQIENDGTK